MILDIIGSGEKAEAVVRFPSVGEKRLLLSWAPLERVSLNAGPATGGVPSSRPTSAPTVPVADALARRAPSPLTRPGARRRGTQLPGVTNEDGWGLAWWEDPLAVATAARSPSPTTTTATPSCRATHACVVIAAIRRATPGLAARGGRHAPCSTIGLAFSLERLRRRLPPGRRPRAALRAGAPSAPPPVSATPTARCCSPCVLDRLDAGAAPADGADRDRRARPRHAGRRLGRARLNLLVSDGAYDLGDPHGDSLFACRPRRDGRRRQRAVGRRPRLDRGARRLGPDRHAGVGWMVADLA